MIAYCITCHVHLNTEEDILMDTVIEVVAIVSKFEQIILVPISNSQYITLVNTLLWLWLLLLKSIIIDWLYTVDQRITANFFMCMYKVYTYTFIYLYINSHVMAVSYMIQFTQSLFFIQINYNWKLNLKLLQIYVFI